MNLNTIESKYYNIKQTGVSFQKASSKGFSILHCNIRSLPKNLTLLNDILITVKELPSIIAVTETKLAEFNLYNISIPGYNFVNNVSKTNAGGAGLYIKDNLKFTKRTVLNLILEGLETCFIEQHRAKLKSIITGCVYRHPSNDREKFHEILD